MAKLVLSVGGAVVHQCFVDAGRLTVGRERHNGIVIDDASVSREHAAITAVGNDHILEDLASANGTWVNGARTPRRILQHGDVMTFGDYHLRYLNPRVAGDVDLERTMYIPGLAERDAAASAEPTAPKPSLPAARTPRTNFPKGRAWMMSGARAGEVLELERLVVLFGKPGEQSAVVTRRPRGYFVTHVHGRRYPRVNGQPIGRQPLLLKHGDVVDVTSEKFEFTLDDLDRRKAPQRRRP